MSLDQAKGIVEGYRRGELLLEEAAIQLAILHINQGWGFYLDTAGCPPSELERLRALERRAHELIVLWQARQGGADLFGTA